MLIVTHLIKNFLSFIQAECSLPCPQKPVTQRYVEVVQRSQLLYTLSILKR
jgi:hypothetical protein